MRLLPSLLALLLAAALPEAGAAQTVQGFSYTREVDISAPGWVRVPLDLAAVQHLLPQAADLRIFDLGGREVARRVILLPPRIEKSTVQIVGAEPAKGGWSIVFDVGAEPPLHQALSLGLSHPVLLPSVVLEGSRDGTVWQMLAVSDLSPSAPLAYAPTQDRFLRLLWPETAGAPAVTGAAVEAVIGPSIAVAAPLAHCEARPHFSACRLALPAARQVVRRLIIDLEGQAQEVSYRLYAPRSSRWQLLKQGVWRRAGERTRHVLPGGPEPVAGSDLRLELSAEGEAQPILAGHGFDLAVPAVVFEATAPGRYTLAYGGSPKGKTFRGDPPANGAALLQAAGPERAHPAPPIAPSLTVLGAALGSTRFSSSWEVVAPAAKAGGLVRLELPDAVYAAARPDLGDLRLTVGRREIPFFRWSPPDPERVVEQRELPLARIGRSQESQADVALPGSGLPLTELHLTASGQPFRRAVGVRYAVPSPLRAGRRERTPVSRRSWDCSPDSLLPCRKEISLPGRGLEVLSVRFENLEKVAAAPPKDIDLELWRRGDILLFVWPAEGPIRLLAGAESLAAPRYGLAALGEELLARPWHPAELDRAGEVGSPPWWSRWVRPAVLWIAVICLLILLRRILPDL